MPNFKKLSVVHPYLEGRRHDVKKKLYPKHHLWGLESIEREKCWSTNLISTENIKLPCLLERILNKLFFRHSPGVRVELACWQASKSVDLIYSVCGPLSLSRFYKKTKLISWVFRKPERSTNHFFDPYHSKNLEAHAAFLCLTPNAQQNFSKHTFSKFIPWCVDLEMFNGKACTIDKQSSFFLATGKTGRDYETLINGAKSVPAELRIIGPKEQCPKSLPENIKWINTSNNQPDQAIDYPTLREWYAQCIAACIPLSGDAEDTCGYTNMLEGMAMAKPILMTKSGCLHIDPANHGFGISIDPASTSGWTNAMTQILNHPEQASAFGNKGREIAIKEFSVDNFDRKVVNLIKEVINE